MKCNKSSEESLKLFDTNKKTLEIRKMLHYVTYLAISLTNNINGYNRKYGEFIPSVQMKFLLRIHPCVKSQYWTFQVYLIFALGGC